MGATSAVGQMTMWSASDTTIVGGSCEYANYAQGGIASAAAQSPYALSKFYCAVSADLYESGLGCGRCYKITFDGTDTSETTGCSTAGSAIIQVVDSGSAKEFDCQTTAFEAITGCDTGVMGITYEEVACEGPGPATATVIYGGDKWYTKLVFSNLPHAVATASITVGGAQPVVMSKIGGPWAASTSAALTDVAVTFDLVLDDGSPVTMTNCFGTWPQSTGASCTVATSEGNANSDSASSDANSDSASSDANSDSNCAAEWGQCGGNGVDRCCVSGTSCFKEHEWYSQCLTACPSGWACDARRSLRTMLRRA